MGGRSHEYQTAVCLLQTMPFAYRSSSASPVMVVMVRAVKLNQWDLSLSRPGGSSLTRGEGKKMMVLSLSVSGRLVLDAVGSTRKVKTENRSRPWRWVCLVSRLATVSWAWAPRVRSWWPGTWWRDPSSRYSQARPFFSQLAHIGARMSHLICLRLHWPCDELVKCLEGLTICTAVPRMKLEHLRSRCVTCDGIGAHRPPSSPCLISGALCLLGRFV